MNLLEEFLKNFIEELFKNPLLLFLEKSQNFEEVYKDTFEEIIERISGGIRERTFERIPEGISGEISSRLPVVLRKYS